MSIAKNTESVLAGQLIAGAKKHFSSASSLAFGNGTFTPAQVESSLQSLVDLRTAVDALRAATQAKVAAEEAQAPPLRSQMAAFVVFVRATFGNSPDVLADFGLKPKKAKAPLTLEQKATAAARRAATRKARHTLGKTQKKDVKGTVTTIVASTPSAGSSSPTVGNASPPVASATVPGTSAVGATAHGT
jgi:hypothetical protein